MLVIGVDANGSEGPRGLVCAIVENEFSLGEHDVAYDAPVLFHHEVELGDEVGVVSELVEHEMLGASRTIDVPEGFAREILHLTVIAGLF